MYFDMSSLFQKDCHDIWRINLDIVRVRLSGRAIAPTIKHTDHLDANRSHNKQPSETVDEIELQFEFECTSDRT